MAGLILKDVNPRRPPRAGQSLDVVAPHPSAVIVGRIVQALQVKQVANFELGKAPAQAVDREPVAMRYAVAN